MNEYLPWRASAYPYPYPQLLHEESADAPADSTAPRADSLGRLLMDFLHFYGVRI